MDVIAEAVERLLFDPHPMPDGHVDALVASRVTVNPMWCEVAMAEAARSARLRAEFEAQG